MRYLVGLVLTTLASPCVTALGINCRGSSNCYDFLNPYNPGQSMADSLREEIADISGNPWYQNGQHIVCVDGAQFYGEEPTLGSVCAFLQGTTGGLPVDEIKTLATRIVEHGCQTCGSVPAFFDKGDNDLKSHGELTFNYVSRFTMADGKCRSISGACQYQ